MALSKQCPFNLLKLAWWLSGLRLAEPKILLSSSCNCLKAGKPQLVMSGINPPAMELLADGHPCMRGQSPLALHSYQGGRR